MKKNLLITFGLSLIAMSVAAQDTLKVDFTPLTVTLEADWQILTVSDKVLYENGPVSFTAFESIVTVEPIWLYAPQLNNIRAIDRTINNNYTGSLAEVLRSYIAVDSRYVDDCNILRVQLSGLPQGEYTWESYHHDFNDQHGSFNAIPLDVWDDSIRLITHSQVIATFPDGLVKGSLDSVCTYKTSFTSSGPSDVIYVDFQNILPSDAAMDHSLKLILINGFKLYKSGEVGIETQELASRNLNIINQPNGTVSITGKNIERVDVYSMNGLLVNSVSNTTETTEIGNLQKGIYIAKVRFFNGELANKKFAVY